MSSLSQFYSGGPINDIPKVSGLEAAVFTGFGSQTGTTIGGLLAPVTAIVSSNTTTSYVDAINYTGAGVLEFCAFYNREGATFTEQDAEILIDGVSVFSFIAAASSQFRCPVGAVAFNATTYVHSVSLGTVPFRKSLQIRHKRGATSGTSWCWAKVRKTA